MSIVVTPIMTTILKTIIDMGLSINLKLLRYLGVNNLQGYYSARPQSVDQYKQLIEVNHVAASAVNKACF